MTILFLSSCLWLRDTGVKDHLRKVTWMMSGQRVSRQAKVENGGTSFISS